MPVMKRLITYLYLYDGHTKSRNAGFSRIEILKGQCRIEVHLRKCGFTGLNCPVYLCAGTTGNIQGIEIGNILIQNGNGDLKLVLPEPPFPDSSYEMKDVHGMLIKLDGKQQILSQWDDVELAADRIFLLQKNNILEFPGKALAAAEALAEEPGEPEARPEAPEPESEARSEASEPESGESEARPDEKEDCEPEEKPADIPPEMRILSGSRQPWKVRYSEQVTTAQTQQQLSADQPPEHKTEISWAENWQKLKCDHPQVCPFHDHREVSALRLDLKDIRKLPKQYWNLGNNSFLLHGFFNYRFLIIGKMEFYGKENWFLGVPGVYQNQERVMAAVFGFPEYRPEEEREYLMGCFGYWIRFLDLEETEQS